MQKFTGFRGLKRLRSLAVNRILSSDTGGSMYGSFANLKITAEKLVKEQTMVKIDIEMARAKLRRATEQINHLEGKFQQVVNENAKFKVNQTEYSKLWQGLGSKVSSTKTLCYQLTESLQQLASQTERAEEATFEENIEKNSMALDELNCLLHDLSAKLECAEMIISGKQQMLQIKHEKELDQSCMEWLCANDTTINEKDLQHQYVELMSESKLKINIEELRSEAEISSSNFNQLETLASELKEEIQKLLEDSTFAQNYQQELLEKIPKLESDNHELVASAVNYI